MQLPSVESIDTVFDWSRDRETALRAWPIHDVGDCEVLVQGGELVSARDGDCHGERALERMRSRSGRWRVEALPRVTKAQLRGLDDPFYASPDEVTIRIRR